MTIGRGSFLHELVERAGGENLFADVTASSGNRETTFDVVRRTAEEVFIPLTVGGGVRGVAALLQDVACRAWLMDHGLAVPPAGGGGAGGDASGLLANASLVVQHVAGVPTEPLLVPPGPDGVLDAAVEKAYRGKRRIAWMEVLAGQKAFQLTGDWR